MDDNPFFMLQTFLDYLLHQRKYSAHTIKAYERDIEQFGAYLSEKYESEYLDTTRDMVRSWVVSLMDTGVSSSTVSRKLASLSSFFKFLQSLDRVKTNPVKLVAKPKKTRALPKFVEARQMDYLFNSDYFEDSYWGMQDRVILEVFFGTGVRLAELVNIKDVHIDLASGTLRVIGKRNKERIIPLTQNLVSVLAPFLEKKEQSDHGNLPYLFATKKGKKLYPKFVYRLVNTYLQKVTTMKHTSPHVLRHTFATQMLNKGADINAIKEILGHANLAATQVYTHNSIEKNKQVLKKSHPRG